MSDCYFGMEDAPFLGAGPRPRSTRIGAVKRAAARWYGIGWQLARQLPLLAKVTPKELLAALGCLLLFVTLLLLSTRHGSSQLEIASSSEVCSTARMNPHKVKAPLNPDIAALTSFWPELKAALEAGGQDLPTLERPPYQPDPPSKESIRGRTDLLTQDEATLVRIRHADFLRSIPKYPKKTFEGRGVVILAGGHYSEYAVTSLGVLRESGCTLPVEVWRRDEREEKHGWCDEIEKGGMVCRRLSDYLDTDILAIADGKEMKVFTMLFSSFEEVIFIDADNMALQRPEILFDSSEYRSTGVVLWPDYWKYDSVDWLEYCVGIAGNRSEALWNQTTYESGQIMWHKNRQWEALLLATYYNYYGPDLYYTLVNHGYAGWGDKDTFPLALRALGKSFHTVPYPPQDVWVNGRVDDRRTGMLQMNVVGSSDVKDGAIAFFLHATTIKWSHRDFVCDGCLPIWHTDSFTEGFISRWEDGTAELNPQLRGNLRILDESVMEHMPIVATSVTAPTDEGAAMSARMDPEIMIWRAMEYAACRSQAWRHERTCAVARRYMMETFGFTFVLADEPSKNTTSANGGEPWLPNMAAEVCVVDPS